jgi:hypothetical protein
MKKKNKLINLFAIELKKYKKKIAKYESAYSLDFCVFFVFFFERRKNLKITYYYYYDDGDFELSKYVCVCFLLHVKYKISTEKKKT